MQNSSIGIGIPKAVLIKLRPSRFRKLFVFFFSAPQNQFNLLIRPKIRINPFLHGQFVDFLYGHINFLTKNLALGKTPKKWGLADKRGLWAFCRFSLLVWPTFKSCILPFLVYLAILVASFKVSYNQAETFFTRNFPKGVKPKETNPSQHSFTSLLFTKYIVCASGCSLTAAGVTPTC